MLKSMESVVFIMLDVAPLGSVWVVTWFHSL